MRTLLFLLLIAGLSLSAELSLQNALELLRKNNFDVRSSNGEIKKAHEEINEAKSAFYPSLDISGYYNYLTEKSKLKIDLPVIGTREQTVGQNYRTELGLDLVYPLFTGKSRFYNLSTKNANLSSKVQGSKVVQNRTSFIMSLLYLRWQLSFKQLEFRKKIIEQMSLYTSQIRMQLEGGVVIPAKLLDAQAKLQSAQLDYILARDLVDSLRMELMGIINIPDSSYMPQAETFAFDTIRIPESVLTTRPEIELYNQTFRQIDNSQKILRAQYFPSLYGSVGYRIANPGLTTGANEFMDYFTIGAQIKWNLFDGFKKQAQRRQFQEQIAIVNLDKEKNLDQWTRNMNLWKMHIQGADERIMVAEASMKAAQELVTSLESSLKSGVITDVDYVTAVNNYEQAVLLMDQAKFNKRVAILNVLYASGIQLNF